MYTDIIFKVDSNAKSPLQIVVHVDKQMTEPSESATEIVSILRDACLATYTHHQGRMELQCFEVNTDFIYNLALSDNRPAFIDYNNLFAPKSSKDSPLFGTHHMVELLYKDFFIGVDVAAEQYRQDGTIAEITIGRSHEHLNELLLNRFKLTESWRFNEIRKDPTAVKLLQQNRIKKPSEGEKIEPSTEKVDQFIEVSASGCRCSIL